MKRILCVTVKYNAHPVEIFCRSSRFYCGSVMRSGIALSGKALKVFSLRCRMLSRASQINEEQTQCSNHQGDAGCYSPAALATLTILWAQQSSVSSGSSFFPTDLLGSNPYKCKIRHHFSSQHIKRHYFNTSVPNFLKFPHATFSYQNLNPPSFIFMHYLFNLLKREDHLYPL